MNKMLKQILIIMLLASISIGYTGYTSYHYPHHNPTPTPHTSITPHPTCTIHPTPTSIFVVSESPLGALTSIGICFIGFLSFTGFMILKKKHKEA
jgi:hypothetical protein